MQIKDYFNYLVNEIHTVVVATVDDENLPVTAAIDLMDFDENGLYFLTAKGKRFYERLRKRGYIALTGMKGADTMSSVAVSVRGRVRELGFERILALFEKNPYMKRIYPTEESMRALTVFQLYEGTGEWFDLSKTPVERDSFAFGEIEAQLGGYLITNACIGCGSCLFVCPQQCIDVDSLPFTIRQRNCLHCGRCFEVCPQGAIEKRD